MLERCSKKEESKKLEEGMASLRRNSSLYLTIVSIIFIFTNIAALTPLTGIPVFFYKHKYLCKKSSSSSNFNIVCSSKFICSNNKKLGIDYIFDPKNDINLKSFITSYDIYCSGAKKILLASSFFLGQLIGTIIYPYLISYFGLINSLSMNYFTIFISYIIIAKYNYYIIGLIFYIISSLSFQICVIAFKQYIVEMTDPIKRPIYLLFNLLSQILSGFFVVLISYLTLDYKCLLFYSSIICIIGAVLVKIFVVESTRILFIQGKMDKLFENMEYISKINKSKEYYEEWKNNNKNFFYNDYDLINNDENLKPLLDKDKTNNNIVMEKDEKLSHLNEINYLSIWKYFSQVKLIILFSFSTFYVNYSLVLAQLEIVKQNKYIISLLEGYSCDMVGYIFGIMITEVGNYTRNKCFLFLTFLLALMYLIGTIFYYLHNQFIFIFFRICVNSLDANFNLYNFESFPTLTRSTGVAINRIFGKFFNIFTPLIMINFTRFGYLCGLLFGVILFILSLFLNPKETKDHKINDFPIEIINKLGKGEIIEESKENKNNDEEEEYLIKNKT